jgi:acetyl-CoA C-acetyltransferase
MYGNVAIAGIGEVPTGIFPHRTPFEAASEAARAAVRDSGLHKDEIDVLMPAGAIFSRSFNTDLIFGRLVEELGLAGTCEMNVQVMAGGASASAMVKIAGSLVATGVARHVLCVQSDKIGSGVSTRDAIDIFSTLGIPEEWEQPYGQHFSAIAALVTRRYQHETGTTSEQLASVVVALRKWAQLNPNAMLRRPITVDDVLASPMLSDPLHAKESNMLADGAVAFVVTTAERAEAVTDTPVYVLGGGSSVTHYSLSQERNLGRLGFAKAAEKAFGIAGVDPADIDVAELYDSYPVFCLMTLEELGLVERGQAGAFVAAGETSPGGSLPMTTNGGMLAQGHSVVGGGIALLVEAARQLMGKAGERQVPGARLAVESSTGGSYMDGHVLVLGSERR